MEEKNIEKKNKIIIIEDHQMFAEGLKMLIESDGDYIVSGITKTINEGYLLIQKHNPDLIIVDINLDEGSSGLELISKACARYPDLKFLVLSMFEENVFAERALRAGAVGYVMKKEMSSTLIKAIKVILDGEIYLSRKIISRVLKSTIKNETGNTSDQLDSLSNREFEIFRLIGQGYKTSEIAKTINVSVKTVDTHRLRIRKKLTLPSSGELQKFAVSWVKFAL